MRSEDMKTKIVKAVAGRRVSRRVGAAARIGALAASSLAFVGLLLLVPGIAFAQGKNIVVLAPHPDDEALCCSGVIYNALQHGDNVNIVVVTNGDSSVVGT